MPEPSSAEIDAVIVALELWVPALLPDARRAATIVSACRAAAADADPREAFAGRIARIERAAHSASRHVVLMVDDSGTLEPTTAHAGWPPPDLKAIRRRGGGVGSVCRSDDGIVTLRVDSLEPFDVAEPWLDAAVALSVGASGVVLDLRGNTGGDPMTAAFLAGFVLGPHPVVLATVHGTNGVEDWSTMPPPAAACVPGDVPVGVLVGPATFSAAEGLAYHLQARERVVVFGERTPGAADHAAPVVLTRWVRAQLPTARVVDTATGTNWEGRGVIPDVAADDPERASHDWIRASSQRAELRT